MATMIIFFFVLVCLPVSVYRHRARRARNSEPATFPFASKERSCLPSLLGQARAITLSFAKTGKAGRGLI